MQVHTQNYGRRPYGVGLLIAGYDVGDRQSVIKFVNCGLFPKYPVSYAWLSYVADVGDIHCR